MDSYSKTLKEVSDNMINSPEIYISFDHIKDNYHKNNKKIFSCYKSIDNIEFIGGTKVIFREFKDNSYFFMSDKTLKKEVGEDLNPEESLKKIKTAIDEIINSSIGKISNSLIIFLEFLDFLEKNDKINDLEINVEYIIGDVEESIDSRKKVKTHIANKTGNIKRLENNIKSVENTYFFKKATIYTKSQFLKKYNITEVEIT